MKYQRIRIGRGDYHLVPKAAEGDYHLVFDEGGEYQLGTALRASRSRTRSQALARESETGRARSAEAAAVLVGLGGDGI